MLLPVTGCGDEAAPSGQAIATNALIASSDFPPRVEQRKSVVSEAPCNPKSRLRAAETSESPTFIVEKLSAQQVVAVFRTESEARSALDSLSSPDRRECVEGALEIYTSTRAAPGSVASTLPLRTLDIGDEARLMGFVIDQPGSIDPRINSVQIRVGRAVTDVLFLSETTQMPNPFIEDIAGKAASHLAAELE